MPEGRYDPKKTAQENPHNVKALAGLIKSVREKQKKEIEAMFADDPDTTISLDEETPMGPKKKKEY